MKIETPGSLKIEHEQLHAELIEATKAGGRVGDAAKALAQYCGTLLQMIQQDCCETSGLAVDQTIFEPLTLTP